MDDVDQGDSALQATIANTFDVLGWEIELAAARSIYLDSMIGRIIGLLPEERKGEFVESMHVVDLLSQQLTGLSAFTRRMSGEAPDVSAFVHSALSQISLGAMADRMGAALGAAERGIDDGADAGELDLL